MRGFGYDGARVAKTSDPRRAGAWPGGLALVGACVFMTACFRDEGPGQQCADAGCSSSTTGPATSDSSSGTTEAVTPTSTSSATDTTGGPIDTAITLRLDSMVFIDPHLFVQGEGGDTGTGGEMASCLNDVTDTVNNVLAGDISEGKFNLMVRFDASVPTEVRVIDGDCEPPETQGGLRVCRPSDSTTPVILTVEPVAAPPCRELDTSVYQAINVPMINAPGLPCVRTRPAQFSLPVSDAVGSLNLRDAQIVATFDDPLAPTVLTDGVLSGFLPKASAEDLLLEVPLLGTVDLWTVLEAPACVADYPELLPSVDSFEINDMPVPGVWVAINFTAERVEYRP
jgi:hypothetical protein